MKTLLLYNLQSMKGAQIRQLAASLHIVCKDILPADYRIPIGAFCGLSGAVPSSASGGGQEPFTDEMMVFCGFGNEDIYDFLTRYKQAGLEPVWLKASLTPSNVTWDSLQLHHELSEEHRQLNGNPS